MAYLGREPIFGEVIVLDSIESQFNGSLTTFSLTRQFATSTVSFFPVSSEQLLVSLGGVIQRPDRTGNDGYYINTDQIVFAVAPPAGTTCFIISYGHVLDIGTPANDSVTTTKIADGSVTPAKLSTGGPYWDTSGNLGIGTSSPAEKLDVVGDIQVGQATTTSTGWSIIRVKKAEGSGLVDFMDEGAGITTTTNPQYMVGRKWNERRDSLAIWRFVGSGNGGVGGHLTADALFQSSGDVYVSNNLGIGTTNPTGKLEVAGDAVISHTGANPLDLYKYGTTAPTILMYGANGTAASPTQTLTGDVIGGWNAFGYGSSGWAGGPSVRITAVATEDNGTTSNRGADIKFETVTTGGTSLGERLCITSDGKVGIGTSNPSSYFNNCDDLVIAGSGNIGLTISSSSTTAETGIAFSDGTSGNSLYVGRVVYDHSLDRMQFDTNALPRVYIDSSGHLLPAYDATYDLGSATNSWRNIYTNDLNLSNEKMDTGNDVDGTKGNWTIQEGETNLYIINNKNGKKYKFALEEIA